MKVPPILRISWHLVNVLLVAALCFVAYSTAWEFSTRSYLKGFSDAIIPASDDAEHKVDAILAWMEHGTARRVIQDTDSLDNRNPENTLNYRQFLEVCGTATNAFVNLAESSGLHARRLLLLDGDRRSKHVVVEVFMDDKWAVVDPSFRSILRLPNGEMVTRAELMDPAVFQSVIQSIPNYPALYSYERTSHVRLSRIPIIGKYLRGFLNFIWPTWEEKINWTLIVERESFALLVVSVAVLCFVLTLRFGLGLYCYRRFGIVRLSLRDRVLGPREVFSSNMQQRS
jgi:hypothetical protein